MLNNSSKIEKLFKSVKDIHKSSFYSDRPMPKLIAVSKKQPIEKIKEALEIGHKVYGENQVQEAEQRWSGFLKNYHDLELHFIGHLQRNKAKKALYLFDCIQSLDRESLALEVSKHLNKNIKTKSFMIQVNTGSEEKKSGISLKNFKNFLGFVKSLKIPVNGLMCIPPATDNPNTHFSLLRDLANNHNIKNLSMGMSSDFENAIKLGATHLRIGTSFFGQRL